MAPPPPRPPRMYKIKPSLLRRAGSPPLYTSMAPQALVMPIDANATMTAPTATFENFIDDLPRFLVPCYLTNQGAGIPSPRNQSFTPWPPWFYPIAIHQPKLF